MSGGRRTVGCEDEKVDGEHSIKRVLPVQISVDRMERIVQLVNANGIRIKRFGDSPEYLSQLGNTDTLLHDHDYSSKMVPVCSPQNDPSLQPFVVTNCYPILPNIDSHMVLDENVLTEKIGSNLVPGGFSTKNTVTLITVISKGAEYRLRTLFVRLFDIARHRSEPLLNNPRYEIVNDVRRQLKFMEEFDEREYKKWKDRIKRAFARLNKGSEIENNLVVNKVMDFECDEFDSAVYRNANAAAIAALGGTQCSSQLSNDNLQKPSSGCRSVCRHRRIRITASDFSLVVAKDPIYCCSPLQYRLRYF